MQERLRERDRERETNRERYVFSVGGDPHNNSIRSLQEAPSHVKSSEARKTCVPPPLERNVNMLLPNSFVLLCLSEEMQLMVSQWRHVLRVAVVHLDVVPHVEKKKDVTHTLG